MVRVRSAEEIYATLDEAATLDGLPFTEEMLPYCGRTARVRARVTRLLDQHTGRMIDTKADCMVLEGVVCVPDHHRFCPRDIYPYWREAWLERVESAESPSAGATAERPLAASAGAR